MLRSEKRSSAAQAATDPGLNLAVVNRARNIRTLTGIVGVVSLLAAFGLFWLYTRQPQPLLGSLLMLYLLAGGFCLFSGLWLYPRQMIYRGLAGISLFFGLAILGTAALLSGLGFPTALVYLIFALIISSSTEKDWQASLAIGSGILISGSAVLLNDYSPFQQISISIAGILTPAILSILFIIFVWMLATQFVATLRIRLVIAFLAIVIVPLAILSIIQSRFMFNVLSQQASSAVQQAAEQTAFGVSSFITETENSVVEASRLEVLSQYLALSPRQRKGSPLEQEMRLTLRVLDANGLNKTIYLSSFALLNMDGVSEYDTLRDRVASRLSPEALQTMGIDLDSVLQGTGANEGEAQYFLVPARSGVSYVSQVELVNSSRGFFYISAPVKNQQGHTVGVLRARYDGQLLQDLLKSYTGLVGAHSYAMLVDDNNIRVADAFTPNFIYRAIAPLDADKIKILKANKQLPDLPENMLSTNYQELAQIIHRYEQQPVFTTNINVGGEQNKQTDLGAISKVRRMPWKVIYLRTDYSDEELRRDQRKLTNLVTTLIAGLVGLIAVITARFLSNPIIQLTQTAQRISNGDLEAQVRVGGSDEFGTLGSAFNLMTGQLRTLIAQLEDRVKARTREIEDQNLSLAHRARQLQTVSDVARQIVSAQELETLLSSITKLISERFHFYHIGIFLLDSEKRYAILRAANSEGGQRMLARRHMLSVGRVGIVGYATGTGQARIATDVGEDAVFFNNPDLPDTRSEMALPLKVNEQVIGALDIQSTKPDDFRPADIELFSTLADQVAIAIFNNQLYSETRQALEEAQNLHRQYLRTEWAEDTSRRKVLGYLYNQSGITSQQSENPLWKKVFASGDPLYAILPSKDGSPDNAVMAVPITVRGETIGVIHVQDQGEDRLWSEDEITVVNSIANQVAVALENARLFENTVRRAEREKKVLQITARIRSTNDPEEMMQIAVSELQQALHASRAQIYVRQQEAVQTAGDDRSRSSPDSDRAKPNGRGAGSQSGSEVASEGA